MIKDLKFVTPESEGLSSESILEFIDFFKELRINLHSFIIVKGGNILAEGYYKPFDKDTKKRIYSCSKTITSYAVGKACGEGLVDLKAPIVSYFPEITDPHPVMATVTVEDVLMMCVPLENSSYCRFASPDGPEVTEDDDWTKLFFEGGAVTDKPSGRLFRYNSLGSSVLCDMIKRVTGKDFLDYLRPELDKIGVSEDIDCIRSSTGFQWGASGILTTTRDFAKMGELLLHKGEYMGEQLLPRDYMERATSRLRATIHGEDVKTGSYGYGYQIWTEPYGYGMHGMRGQVVYCFPDKDFMVVMTSNEPDYSVKYYYAASRLYKAIADKPLPENNAAYGELCQALGDLKIDRSFGAAHSEWEKKISGKTYIMNENSMGLERIRVDIGEGEGIFSFTVRGEEKKLRFGLGEYADTTFPDKTFYGKRSNVRSGREFRTLVTGSWTAEDTLFIIADVSDDTPGSLGISLEFFGDSLAAELRGTGEGILDRYNVTCSGKYAD